jgi:transposase-like protein
MSTGKRRVYSREFKVSAVKRMLAGEHAAALARELQIPAGHLYKWCRHFRRGGPEALRAACRPRKGLETPASELASLATARKRISDLERKIGQQQVELDFFRQALRRVGGARQPSDGLGAPTSTRSSKR